MHLELLDMDLSVSIIKPKRKIYESNGDIKQIKVGDSINFNKHGLKGSVKLSGEVIESLNGGRLLVESNGERYFVLLSDIIWSARFKVEPDE
jgi:hypothetical protein